MATPPNFSAFPWDRVPRVSKADARVQSIVARWVAARPSTSRLAALLGTNELRARVVSPSLDFDPHAARCIVRVAGADIEVRGSSVAVRAIANKVLGGPAELAAPRPLNVVEESIWCLVVATGLEDLGIAGTVWSAHAARRAATTPIELEIHATTLTFAVQLHVPPNLELRAPRERMPTWAQTVAIDVPIVVGRCAIARSDLGRLQARSLVTIDSVGPRPRVLRGQKPALAAAELEILGGVVGVRCPQGAVVGEVVTGYLPRPMSLPDDAHVELTVGLGTTCMTLRQVFELAVGQVVTLGRPLAGPFEVRAAGKRVGTGELVDVDGELAVRIVSLGDQE